MNYSRENSVRVPPLPPAGIAPHNLLRREPRRRVPASAFGSEGSSRAARWLKRALALLRPVSLFRKLSLCFLAFVLVLGGIQYFVLNHYWFRGMAEADQRLYWELPQIYARELRPLLAVSGETPGVDADKVKKALHRLSQLNPKVDIYLLDKRGNRLREFDKYGYRFAANFTAPPISLEPIRQFLRPSDSHPLPILGDDPMRKSGELAPIAVTPIEIGKKPGYLYIVLHSHFYDRLTEGLEAFYAIVAGVVVTVMLSTLVCALGVVFYHLVTRRFRRLTRAVAELRRGNIGYRSHLRGRDEIGRLGGEIDQMAETIEQIVRRSADAAETDRLLYRTLAGDLAAPIRHARDLIAGCLANAGGTSRAKLSDALASLELAEEMAIDIDTVFTNDEPPAAEATEQEFESEVSDLLLPQHPRVVRL